MESPSLLIARAINYISKCYGGRASRYYIPGDQISADRRFTLKDDLAAGASAELLIPAFTRGKSQLSAKEVEVSWKRVSVNIHIERIIGLLKNRYTILQGILRLRLLKTIKDKAASATFANCDKIVK